MTAVAWGVWCTVSGGVTGHREAWMKIGGVEWRGSQEEAEAKAAAENARPKGSYTGAVYSYVARPVCGK